MTAGGVTWLETYTEVREALKRSDLQQASYDGAKDTVFADTLVTLDGSPHGRRRRAEQPLFRPAIVAALENTVVPDAAGRLVAELRDRGEADLVAISRLVSTSLAAQIVGLDDCDTLDRLDELAALMAKLHEGVIIEWSTRPREELLAEVAVARDRYRARFLAPSLRRREQLLQETGERAADPRDLIHLLLVHREAQAMDPEKILRESVHYLVASAHTTATVVVHGGHELWAWVAEHPEDVGKLADPIFVQAGMSEAMRLWPPSGWQFRIASRDFVLRSGRRVHAGEKLGLHLAHANRDPSVFGADAGRFDPYRRPPRGVPAFGLAFGDGPHVCIGKRLTAGLPGTAGAAGSLAAIAGALFAAGCRPHPTRPPVSEPNTARHQYRSYPVEFSPPSGRPGRAAAPLPAVAPAAGRA